MRDTRGLTFDDRRLMGRSSKILTASHVVTIKLRFLYHTFLRLAWFDWPFLVDLILLACAREEIDNKFNIILALKVFGFFIW